MVPLEDIKRYLELTAKIEAEVFNTRELRAIYVELDDIIARNGGVGAIPELQITFMKLWLD